MPASMLSDLRRIISDCHEAIGEGQESDDDTLAEGIRLRIQERDQMIAYLESALADVELKYRRTLWAGHGCGSALYGDDGEMQCNNSTRHGLLDFKRDPLVHLEGSLSQMRMRECFVKGRE